MAKGVYKWMAIDRIGTTVITFTGNIVLARLLTQFDFGLLGMLAMFIGLAYNASSCGLSDGLINKAHPTERDYSTVFVFNAGMGIVLGSIFILCSKIVANFFGYPELIGIMWAVGICFFFNTLVFTQETRMRKELSIKKMCIVRISASVCAVGLGIWLAANGYSYWGLVSCRVFLSFFLFVFYVIASRWFPKIAFYKDSFKELFGYGINLMWAYMVTIISRYINSTVLGTRSSADSGIYSQAQKMEEVPFGIIETTFNWPFFAVAANELDPVKRKQLCREMLQWMSLLNISVGMLLMLLSAPGFLFLFGEKWMNAVPIFRILIIFGIASALKAFFQTILKLHSRTALIRNYSIVELIIQLGLLAIAYPYGIKAIAWSQIVALGIILGVYLFKYHRLEDEKLKTIFMDMLSPLSIPFAAFIVTAIGYTYWNDLLNPFVSCVVILALFCSTTILLWEFFPHPIYIKYRARVLSHFNLKK